MIYVICPYGLITGGPDALHQMVYYLNKIDKDAKLVYTNLYGYNPTIPIQYSCYIDGYLTENDIIDDEKNTIIIPEFLSHKRKKYKKANIFIWWLSVLYNKNNTSMFYKLWFLMTYVLRIYKYKNRGLKNAFDFLNCTLFKEKYKFKNEQKNINHLCASYYAYDYVSKKTIKKCELCIEPISKIFLENYGSKDKQDQVIYNPKKCGKFAKKIINSSKNIKFIPLIGMTQEELINMYKKSKLYIDFGPFPGAERMPKEAVINDCLILTGKNGASAFYEDVMIPNQYKIESKKRNICLINEKIHMMLKEYDFIIHDFSKYKEKVINLEKNFIEAIKEI